MIVSSRKDSQNHKLNSSSIWKNCRAKHTIRRLDIAIFRLCYLFTPYFTVCR
ncbi:hypothetical protein RHMOL_Rhmol06G0229200 [Rhododendron molle]|uniref:Uncharacterized protein n=1 Tax=Rhododendron molle TaxID=49168 RepID=A0ACC0NGD9_RHOML|nr:hypothetical protein RHMOL_Rhmol06G0229200 [Rhododendron molle]